MLLRLSSWIDRVSTGRVTLAALALFLLFMILVLPRQAASAQAAAGGAGSPDTSLLYTTQDLYRFAESYGETGIQAYVQARITFDVVFPLVYGFFLVTALSWLYARSFRAVSRWQQANLVPLVAVLFDFLENLATSLVMLRYPQPTPVVDSLAPAFTLVKWLLVSGSFALLLLGVLAGAARLFGARAESIRR